jgi:UDP-N-acetylmuramate: L-alanyl-gamma-D-glutamyl-meso-diaminopimelate ligase
MKYHFIGICGAGMSAVAKLLNDEGHTVTGSDEGFYPPISLYLEKHHIPCATPYKKENIPDDVDAIVIGKHAKLTKEDNVEVAHAFSLGKKIESFPEVLARITKDRERIVVAGSYGKSTCSALLSHILESADKNPGYFIGAVPLTPKSNAEIGTGKEFILEGDEYPSLNWDSTSKFLYYHPKEVLLTALAHDHVNIFATHEEYIAPFLKLLEEVPEDGLSVVCLDEVTIQKHLSTLPGKHIVTYGLTHTALWSASDIQYGETTSFTLTKNGESVIRLTTTLLGKHNIQNCIGVSALLLETKKITPEELQKTLATFKGIVRRLDKKSEKTTIPLYEGFGSSVDKARSAIDAIKLHFPEQKLLILFEPHTFSWRNRGALSWYDTVFAGADEVLIYKPPEHGSATHDQLSLTEITERVKSSGIVAIPFEDKKDALAKLRTCEKNTVILILSSGSMDGLIEEVIKLCEELFPKK